MHHWLPELLPLAEEPADPLGLEDLATHRVPLEQAPEMYESSATRRRLHQGRPEALIETLASVGEALLSSPFFTALLATYRERTPYGHERPMPEGRFDHDTDSDRRALTPAAATRAGPQRMRRGDRRAAGDDDADYDPDAELSGDLTVMGFSGVDEVATSRIEFAEAELGDVEVKLIEGDLDIQQFLSAVASGEPPELLYADRDQIGSLAARGAIIPLDDCIDGEGIDIGQFRESALDQVTLDGKVYGIPEFNQVQVTMANADLLAAAGVTIEDVNGSDWEAMTGGQRGPHEGGRRQALASSASTPSCPSSCRCGSRRPAGR